MRISQRIVVWLTLVFTLAILLALSSKTFFAERHNSGVVSMLSHTEQDEKAAPNVDLDYLSGIASRENALERISPDALLNPNIATLLVWDSPGAQARALLDGELFYEFQGLPDSAPIVGGKCMLELDIKDNEALSIRGILESGEARYFPPDLRPFSQDGGIIECFSYPGRFICSGGQTDLEFSDFVVYRNRHGLAGSIGDGVRHPGNVALQSTVSFHQGPGWAYLPALPDDASGYWVRYAKSVWRHILTFETHGGPPIVLDGLPGCALEISIADFIPTKGLVLLVLVERTVIAEFAHIDQPLLRLEGLPEGNVDVLLAFDHGIWTGEEIDQAQDIALRSDREQVIGMTMPALPESNRRGTISGSLTVEAAEIWKDLEAFQDLAVLLVQSPPTPGYLALSDSMRRISKDMMTEQLVDQGQRIWHWQMDNIPEGDYTLRVNAIGIEEDVHVVAGQVVESVLHIPPVARTLIDVYFDGRPRSDALVFLVNPSDTASSQLSLSPSNVDGIKSYNLLTLPGEVSIEVYVPGSPRHVEQLTAYAGWNVAEVRLEPCPGFELVVEDMLGNAVYFERWFDLELVPVSGIGSMQARSVKRSGFGNSSLTRQVGLFTVTESGEYDVVLPPLETTVGERRVVRVKASVNQERFRLIL